MSTIKVDTIATRTGSGNITASNTIAGTSATLSGTLGVTGLTTLSGNASITGDTATLTLTDSSSHSANTGPAISFFSNDSGGTSREVAKIVGESHSGANEGNLALQTRNGGTLETKWKVFKNGNLIPSNSAYGIILGATATGDANLLDDYEEGNFTPTFGGSGGNPTVSYSTQLGTYIKVGKMVQLTVSVIASGTPSGGSGDLIINGIPFTSKSGIQQAGSVAFTNNMNFGGGSGISQVSCNIEGGVAYLNINEHEYNGASGMGRNPTNGITTHSGPRIVCSICYEAA